MQLTKDKVETIQMTVLLSIVFLGQIIANIVNLDFVYHLRSVFSMSAGLIGFAVGLSSIFYCIGCVFFSPLYAHFKPRNLLLFGSFGLSLILYLLSRCTEQHQIWIFIILFGFIQSMIWPSIETWISRGKESTLLNRDLGLFNMLYSLGAGIAPFICTLLVVRSTYLPLLVGSVLALVNGLIILIVSTLVPQMRSVDSEETYIASLTQEDTSTPLRYFGWIGVFLVFLVWIAIQTAFPLYTRENLGLSENVTGILFLSKGLVSCVAFMFLGKVHFWHFKMKYIVGSQLGLALILFVFCAAESISLFFIFFLIFGLLYALLFMQSLFHGASGALERSKRMNIHEVVLNVGIVLGGVVGGSLFQQFNYQTMMIILAIFIMVMVVIELLMYSFVIKKR